MQLFRKVLKNEVRLTVKSKGLFYLQVFILLALLHGFFNGPLPNHGHSHANLQPAEDPDVILGMATLRL